MQSDWLYLTGINVEVFSVSRKAWRELKNALSNSTLFAGLVQGRPKKVMTDASVYGPGGVLPQLGWNDRWAAISLTNRIFKKAKRSYASAERESTAIVHSSQKRRNFLHGASFVVDSDLLSLKWLMSLKNTMEKLARWVV